MRSAASWNSGEFAKYWTRLPHEFASFDRYRSLRYNALVKPPGNWKKNSETDRHTACIHRGGRSVCIAARRRRQRVRLKAGGTGGAASTRRGRMLFHPSSSGVYVPSSLNPDFIGRLSRRVSDGLFPLAPSRRNRYEIIEETEDVLRFRARTLLTALYVGLNNVRVEVDRAKGEVRYHVRYWTWAKFNVFLCLAIGLVLAVLLGTPLFGVYLLPSDHYPPNEAIIAYALPMTAFWGLLWPWFLVALHKGPVARCLKMILEQVNE
jgi:hypothetical protein